MEQSDYNVTNPTHSAIEAGDREFRHAVLEGEEFGPSTDYHSTCPHPQLHREGQFPEVKYISILLISISNY